MPWRRSRLAQHRHGAGEQHERRVARLVGDHDHPVLAGLSRVLTQAIDETHGVPMGGLEPRQFDAVLSRTGHEGDLR